MKLFKFGGHKAEAARLQACLTEACQDRERMHRQAITNALVDVAKAVDALMEAIENG